MIMPRPRTTLLRAAVVASAAALLLPGLPATRAHAEPQKVPVPLPQSEMTVIETDSAEAANPGAAALDGDPATFWHTAWRNGVAPLPHHISVRIAPAPVEVSRVRLQPRLDSNGSGRIGDYELYTSSDPTCADGAFERVASGSFDGLLSNSRLERTITLESPVTASCVKVVWLSSWGGKSSDPTLSPPERVASLAEVNVDTLGDPPPPDPIDTDVPDGAVTITDGSLAVRMHPRFPQVVDYTLDGRVLAGRYGDALDSVVINDVSRRVEVSAPVVSDDGRSVRYHVTVPDLPDIAFDAVASVDQGVLTYRLTSFTDPGRVLRRIAVPRLDLVSTNGTQQAAQLSTARLSVDRGRSGDQFYRLADQAPGTQLSQGVYTALINDDDLAAGFETNAIEDNTAGGATASRVDRDNSRFTATVRQGDGASYATVSPGTFVVRGSSADQGLGPDDDPMIRVRVTGDANSDAVVDWQDAAIASRHVTEPINGSDAVPDTVIKRIPFNIDSQATHPFLRTLDDTKRISLATDGLGQSVMLKGYQAEGHDSAHPDYAGHYNQRAGGKADFDALVTQGEAWNATFGVHVNATESQSEAHAFGESLLRSPIQPGWGWMNQSYMIDGARDLGTRAVLDRFQALRDESPENLTFLYMDVYYNNGWEGQRLSQELEKQGWTLSTEWADKFPRASTWSHWANDESYGGSTNKGVNSQILRFIGNADKDVWNPDPLLSNANVQEFEGWTGDQDANAFFSTVWERNLPTKYLQQSDIMSWRTGELRLADGTVVTSPQTSVSGTAIPTDRTITTGGRTVYTGGKYLLPWDDGTQRLYHWNPSGGKSTWSLTPAWASQTSLTMYRLTDSGRVDGSTVPVVDGKVTLTADPRTAYVLYPTSEVAEAPAPEWGEGTAVADPGFFSGGLDAWSPSGAVSVETDALRNRQALFGAGPASVSQRLTDPADRSRDLPAGTWSAWAWVEIDPAARRDVTISVDGSGVRPAPRGSGEAGRAATTVSTSTALNATASDEKHGRHFQRVRVTFTSDGSPVTLAVTAGAGEAAVRVDDVRVVAFTPSEDPAPTPGTVLYEDFEHVDTGYGPFVTGLANRGGDARTQLAERHEPYSQKGWYGLNSSDQAVAGGKLTDNVLTGQWSLMSHEETKGLILRSTPSSLPLVPGHRYRLSLKHQTAFADTYRLVLGTDVVGSPVTSTVIDARAFPEARSTADFVYEFTADPQADTTWIGIEKLGGGRQADLIVDDLRLEDLELDPPAPVQTFSDVPPGSQFAEDIEWLAARGVTTGFPDGTYRPLGTMNRDAMAAFLYRMAGSPAVRAPRNQPFTDVKPGDQHYDAMIWAWQEGIAQGFPDRTFRPTAPITRDAMAAFIYRYAGSPDVPRPTSAPFPDVPADSQFAREITWLKSQGITTGWPDGTYRPLDPIARDAMAAFLHRMEAEQEITFRSES